MSDYVGLILLMIGGIACLGILITNWRKTKPLAASGAVCIVAGFVSVAASFPIGGLFIWGIIFLIRAFFVNRDPTAD